MDLQQSKIALAKLILDIDSQELIDKILRVVQQDSPDFWDSLSEAEKEEIALGIKQLDQGKGVPLQKVLKDIS
ncbi:hypothetical protein [Sediminicola luteus]|uniref:Uncharacterized protein n=1 Tax=Sediminicola luteus TaxID=319238 RepID=A0A2A4GDX7_9FLAO|nr:hypothetical protein [Sediminicola luteus]PCE66653.1 hypothetical protein B7P33_04990 [Sediminicola luteus]